MKTAAAELLLARTTASWQEFRSLITSNKSIVAALRELQERDRRLQPNALSCEEFEDIKRHLFAELDAGRCSGSRVIGLLRSAGTCLHTLEPRRASPRLLVRQFLLRLTPPEAVPEAERGEYLEILEALEEYVDSRAHCRFLRFWWEFSRAALSHAEIRGSSVPH